MGLAVDDRPFDLAKLKFATEAFLTSSLRGIAPLVRLDGIAIGTGTPGPVTRQDDGRLRRARRPGVRRVIIETIVTTMAADGAVNCAPMGVEWDPDDEPEPSC